MRYGITRTSFQNISDEARIWVYQADRAISAEESRWIEDNMKNFLEKWTAHGNELYASAVVLNDFFLVVALDENKNEASGCSIDASVHFIQALQRELKVNFFDRMQVVLEEAGSRTLKDSKSVGEEIKSGSWAGDVITYNNLVATKSELETSWKVPLKESWLKKYFNQKNTLA